MQNDQLLQQQLRRSDQFDEDTIFKDLLDYALTVRDEMEVYLYMEEHGIGIHHTAYWIARMDVLKKQGRFVQLVALLNRLKLRTDLQEFSALGTFEFQLNSHMRHAFYGPNSRKRKAAEYSSAIEGVYKKKRMVGNLEIYVDSACRRNYEMEDLAEYIEREKKESCSLDRGEYERKQQQKPLSFIAKQEQQLMALASQVLGKAARKSQNRRRSLQSLQPRPSGKSVPGSNKFEVENYNTPKNSEAKHEPLSKEGLQQKRKKDRSRDSIEILKSMHKEHKVQKQRKEQDNLDPFDLPSEFKSPKFPTVDELPVQTDHPLSNQPAVMQRCRSAPASEQFFSFSFGKVQKSPQSQRPGSQRQAQTNKDNAFMFHSFSQDSRNEQGLVSKQEFELELIIKEIQRQKYEKVGSKTFSSEIGSNQQNEGFVIERPQNAAHRRPFEVLLQAQAKNYPYQQSIRLQELIDFDDDMRNPQNMFLHDPMFKSNHKRREQVQFRSQMKVMSAIREQNSHFYSESKNKHSRSK